MVESGSLTTEIEVAPSCLVENILHFPHKTLSSCGDSVQLLVTVEGSSLSQGYSTPITKVGLRSVDTMQAPKFPKSFSE